MNGLSTQSIPRFVGRRQTLDSLNHAAEAAVAGRPGVVLLSGPPGQGKTRVLREFVEAARQLGASTYYGRCHEGLAPPYVLFEPLLVALERKSYSANPDLEFDAELIRRIVYRASQPGQVDAEVPTAADRGEQEKLRLFLGITRSTIRLAESRPVVLVLDDLHWADSSSLDLFAHLVFAMVDADERDPVHLLVVAAHRPEESGTHLARVLQRVRLEGISQHVELPGLSSAEVEHLLKVLQLSRPSRQLISGISQATLGNPLFIQEVLRHLAESGAIEERGGSLVMNADLDEFRLPAQIGESLEARSSRLSDECRGFLTLAALLGERFSQEKLVAVWGRDYDRLLPLLEEAVENGFFATQGRRFYFAHALVRRVFASAPSTLHRQRLHRDIATALEEYHADDLDGNLLAIAHHLASAGPIAEPERVLHYASLAGDRTLAAFEPGKAAALYEAAIEAAEASNTSSSRDIAELHCRAGFAHQRNQDLGPCSDHYERAIEKFRSIDELAGLATALQQQTFANLTLGQVPYGGNVETKALEEVLRAIGDDEPELRARIYSTLASVYWTGRQPGMSQSMARRALEIGEQLDDAAIQADACTILALSEFQDQSLHDSLSDFQSSIRLARESSDLWALGRALQRIPLPLLALGRIEEADHLTCEARELSRTTQDWAGTSHALAVSASVAVARGDLENGDRLAQDAMEMVRRSGYTWSAQIALPALACARALRGAWAEARDASDVFADISSQSELGVQFLSWLYGELISSRVGQRVQMEPLRAALDWGKEWTSDSYALPAYCAGIELAQRSGDVSLLVELMPPLERARANGVVLTTGWIFLIPRILGVAASLLHRWEKAAQYFDQAISLAQGIGAGPELARTHLDQASMRLQRAGEGDRERAQESLALAIQQARDLQLPPLLAEALQLADTHRFGRDAFAILESPQDRLSGFDRELLIWIAQGRSDEEIAASRMVHSSEISQAVARVIDELGLTSRDHLAAYAQELRIADQATLSDRVTALAGVPSRALHILFFSDMANFSEMVNRLGDERAWKVIEVHDRIIRTAVQDHCGSEIQHTGDGLMVSFTSASAAVCAGLQIQRDLAEHNRADPEIAISVRIGIHAGEPLQRGERLFGAAVNATARICDRADPGTVFVSDAIRHLLADDIAALESRGEIRFKGFARPFQVFAALEPDSQDPVPHHHV